VAIIMDGNGRWAQARGRPRLFGHHAGARRVKEIVRACPDLGVEIPDDLRLLDRELETHPDRGRGADEAVQALHPPRGASLHEENVRVRFIGDRVRLEPALVDLMDGLELMTAGNDGTNLTIALNYGGRDEVTRATRGWPMTWPPESSTRATSMTRPSALPRHLCPARSRPRDPHQRRGADLELPALAVGLCGIRVHRHALARFHPEEFARVLARFGNRERRFGAVPV
jgi:undecaprenyl diphosphate synthase